MNLTTCITDTHEGAWPVLWAIAGTDSGGGAGLAADQRAADACGVHLAPIVAAVTAQNTCAVQRIDVQPLASLDAQMAALADDLPPRVIKTGLLGHADTVIAVARQVDALRERGPVALVVDPVLRASTGAGFADEATLQAYREWLLPRATVLTPNRREAAQLLGRPEPLDAGTLPAMAEALRALGVESVCITGGDSPETGLCHDWIATPEACGWLTAPRVATAHTHGTGCTFASGLASALARGFCAADAAVLAKMLTTDALRRARPVGAGAGPGPVRADARFVLDPSLLPVLWDERQPPTRAALGLPPLEPGIANHAVSWPVPGVPHVPGLYAIVDSSQRAHAVLQAATASNAPAPTIQLRIKAAPDQAPDAAAWHATLALEIRAAQAATDAAGAALYINDHWPLALRLGAPGLHLGQSDLLALSAEDRQTLRQAQANGIRLGLSSHSLWELARAAGWRPSYIACGPVWPTTTKDMPWHPQGLGNLAWWVRMAPAPVVAIGGILSGAQMQAAAATGAAGACVVRGLGQEPSRTLPAWLSAWQCGQQSANGPMRRAAPAWPQACLPSPYAATEPRQPM